MLNGDVHNINVVWSELIVAALMRWGVRTSFVSPGYRNIPMIQALKSASTLTKVVCVDERSAAFQALGCCRAEGRPTLLICTSGTAVANYYPAILEAFEEHLPLMVISADRPFEVIHAGANQVVDQNGILDKFVKKSLSLPTASEEYGPEVVCSHIDLLMRQALGFPCGPVHLNLPLREPLEPDMGQISSAYYDKVKRTWECEKSRVKRVQESRVSLTVEGRDFVKSVMQSWQRPLLIIGRLDGADACRRVAEWVRQLDWPVYCDVGSSLRSELGFDSLLGFEQPATKKLLDEYAPDGILHLGRRLVSKSFDAYIEERASLSYGVVSPADNLQDVSHRADFRLMMPVDEFIGEMTPWLPELKVKDSAAAQNYARGLQRFIVKVRTRMTELPYSPYLIVGAIENQISQGSILFLGNSSAIRFFDLWMGTASCQARRIKIAMNRGISGIEGLISTAIGLAIGSGERVTAVIGDVSALHDLNAFLQLKSLPRGKVTLIILNDRGGGIFRMMPIAAHPEISPYIETPHEFSFDQIASMAGVCYFRASTQKEFDEAYYRINTSGESGVIECPFDAAAIKSGSDALRQLSL
jgi:2-succinyl-5-enolpyruvyl-6-hydroxy-3-cyclohexene-1-carboxylate synthase